MTKQTKVVRTANDVSGPEAGLGMRLGIDWSCMQALEREKDPQKILGPEPKTFCELVKRSYR